MTSKIKTIIFYTQEVETRKVITKPIRQRKKKLKGLCKTLVEKSKTVFSLILKLHPTYTKLLVKLPVLLLISGVSLYRYRLRGLRYLYNGKYRFPGKIDTISISRILKGPNGNTLIYIHRNILSPFF